MHRVLVAASFAAGGFLGALIMLLALLATGHG
jgi:hypothetical protein